MTIDKPTKPCYVCGTNDWWQRPDGGWLCGRCHPNPNPGSSPTLPSNEGKYSSEVLALRDRVIKGNDKLFKAWLGIRDIEDRDEKKYQLDRWNEAQERLHGLCLELKAKGYNDCLYIENGKKIRSCLSNPDGFWCQVCPSRIPYWERDLMKLPSPGEE